MNSKRIQTIANLVSYNHKVIDIGTDHAYVPIILVKERHFTDVTASDISGRVLKKTQENIQKYRVEKQIKVLQNDGLYNIGEKYDTAVITGMGFETIKKIILQAQNLPFEFIIESNNHENFLREFMMKKGYKIINEEIVYENDKYYVIFKYHKGQEILTISEIAYGKNKNKKYLIHLLNQKEKIEEQNHSPLLAKEILDLKKIIEKIPD